MVGNVISRGSLLDPEVSGSALTAIKAGCAWRRVSRWRVKFTRRGHIVAHLAECIRLPAQAALYWFPGKPGSPSGNVTLAAGGGGRGPNHVASRAFALGGLISTSRIGPSRKGHCPPLAPIRPPTSPRAGVIGWDADAYFKTTTCARPFAVFTRSLSRGMSLPRRNFARAARRVLMSARVAAPSRPNSSN